MTDRPRLLAARSELGYVERPAEALPHEPEAVPSSYQEAITHRTTQTRSLQNRLQAGRAVIETELEGLVRAGIITRNQTRPIRRELERLHPIGMTTPPVSAKLPC